MGLYILVFLYIFNHPIELLQQLPSIQLLTELTTYLFRWSSSAPGIGPGDIYAVMGAPSLFLFYQGFPTPDGKLCWAEAGGQLIPFETGLG